MIRILFVCLGNICRSPVAEAIFNELVRQKELSHRFHADSAGTAAYHVGESPDPRSLQNARKNGIYLEHVARQFIESDFNRYDYILAMDHDNLRHILKLAPDSGNHRDSVYLMRSFQSSPDSLDVPDPYYGGGDGFQKVFDILEDANGKLLEHLMGADEP